jgi:hypothetical protein
MGLGPSVSVQTVGMRSRAADDHTLKLVGRENRCSAFERSRGTKASGLLRLFQSRRSVCALGEFGDSTLKLWELEWDLEVCDEVDWDEAARPYLECFLTLHTPYVAASQTRRHARVDGG